MKVLAVESSPRRKGLSKTKLVLEALVSGMRDEGAEVQLANVHRRGIKPCTACHSCFTTQPGRCVIDDVMTRELFPAWQQADLVVYATPVYHLMINSAMKAFIERTVPVRHPYVLQRRDATFHLMRKPAPRAAFVAVAGFPEMSIFEQVSSFARAMFARSLVAEIYRPCTSFLDLECMAQERTQVLASLSDAGRQLVREGTVSPETLRSIARPLCTPEVYARFNNLKWKTLIEVGATPDAAERRGLQPRPESLDDLLFLLPLGFDPRFVDALQATVQIELRGEKPTAVHLCINGGRAEAHIGAAAAPDLTIRTTLETWGDIVSGRRESRALRAAGRWQAKGDLSLLRCLSRRLRA